VGEVVNGSPSPVYNVTVIATFYDTSGALVGAMQALAYLPATIPTQANPFKIQLANAPASVSTYQLALHYDDISIVTYDRPTIISEDVKTENGIEITGQMRNDHRSALQNLVVVTTFYDNTGAVLDVVPGQVSLASIPAGATANYSVQTRQSIPYASYLVQSQGVLYP